MPGGKSRATEHKEKYPDDPLSLPDIDCPELASFLFSAGPTMAGAMGEIALTATELTAWCDGNGIQLTGWEFSTIMAASNAYASEKYAARKIGRAHV